MARIPTEEDLGGLPNLSVPTGLPSIDMTAYGKGIKELGEGIGKFGAAVTAHNKEQDDLLEAQLQANISIAKDKNYYDAQMHPDFEKAPDLYRDNTASVLEQEARKLPEHKRREFIAKNSVDIQHRYNILNKNRWDKTLQRTELENDEKITGLVAQGVQALEDPDNPNWKFFDEKMKEARGLIDAESAAMKRTPAAHRKRVRDFLAGTGKATIQSIMATNPEAAQRILDNLTPGPAEEDDSPSIPTNLGPGAAYLAKRRAPFREELSNPETRKLVGAILSAENPGAGPAVVESLFNRTMLVNQDREAQGKPPLTLTDMIFGHKDIGGGKSFYGPVRTGAVREHLRKLERDPEYAKRMDQNIDLALSGSNVVRGHTDQGSRGDPNYESGGIGVNINGERFNHWGYRGSQSFQQSLQREYEAEERKGSRTAQADTGTATDAAPEGTTEVSAKQKNPGVFISAEGLHLRPQDVLQLKKELESARRAKELDVDRERRRIAAEKQEASQNEMNRLMEGLGEGALKFTGKEIFTNKTLLPEHKNFMNGVLEKWNARDETKDDKTYGEKYLELFQQVHGLAEGKPKLTDPNQLLPYIGNGLNMSGLDKLRLEMTTKSADGASEAAMKNQFLTMAKTMISGRNDMLRIPDPKGERLYTKFMTGVLTEYDRLRREGKSPFQLLNEDSPDYIGKALKPGAGFVRTPTQRMSDMMEAEGEEAAPNASGGKPSVLMPKLDKDSMTKLEGMSKEQLVAAVHTDPRIRPIAVQIAIKKGFMDDPAKKSAVQPGAKPQVPTIKTEGAQPLSRPTRPDPQSGPQQPFYQNGISPPISR